MNTDFLMGVVTGLVIALLATSVANHVFYRRHRITNADVQRLAAMSAEKYKLLADGDNEGAAELTRLIRIERRRFRLDCDR